MIPISNELPFTLISGPCQLQDRDHCFMIADKLLSITNKLNIPLIFKTSFDKANRTSHSSKRGCGLEESLPVFFELKRAYPEIRILTDVHETYQVKLVKPYVDIIQIPAFLSRQTDLIKEVCIQEIQINIKKGQFMSPSDVKHIVSKCKEYGTSTPIITERGTSFGYNQLVVDMTGLQVIKQQNPNIPLIIDGTHAVQQPGSNDGTSGGNRSFVSNLVKAALTYKLAGVFIECHEDPDNAPSDGPNAVRLRDMPKLLQQLKEYDTFIKEDT